MNSTKFLLPLVALLPLVSCSDSDDENTVDPAAEIADSYDGYGVASCRYFSNQVSPDQKVTITPSVTGKANVSYVSDSWGTVTISDAAVAAGDGGYILTGKGTSVMGMGDKTSEYECTLSGTVSNGIAALTFTCPAVMGGLTLEFRQGDIPADIVVPGTYKGYTKASCAYFPEMNAADQTMTIVAEADGTYKATYTSDTWGEFTISGITATAESGNRFALAGEGVTRMGMNGNIQEYACRFAGTVDAAKENPEFTFTVPAVMGGLTISFINGEMPGEK